MPNLCKFWLDSPFKRDSFTIVLVTIVCRKDEHTYIIFNYSSSVEESQCPPNWITGQVA
jgi:hypothetical protein